jgi:hypothetical protein
MTEKHSTDASEMQATVVVRLGGGLGNQLFQYAFGRRMALANDARLILDASGYRNVKEPDPRLGVRALGLDHFKIQGTVTREGSPTWGSVPPLPERPWLRRKWVKWARKFKAATEAARPYHLRRVVSEADNKHFTFDPHVYNRPVRGTVIFAGYWQTERYFQQVETLVRQELTVRDQLDGVNAQVAAMIQAADAVAVHVRHGDNASGVESGLGMLPRSYYDFAIRELRTAIKGARFFVFSEDIDWAKSFLQLGEEAVFVSHNSDSRNYEDLRLMSLCRHHIVANSTFSWWGAWLGKKEGQVVYAPLRYWQNVDRPNLDLYPTAWRRI